MEDFIFTPLVLLAGVFVHLLLLRRHTPAESRLLHVAFFAHVGAGFAQVLLTRYYFPGGDMLGYFNFGVPIAEVVRDDFWRFMPELLAALLRREYEFPVPFYGGGSTLSMTAAAGLMLFFTGSSLYAAVLLISIGSYVSTVLLYRAFKSDFAPHQHRRLLVGVLLLPSAVYWSCALLKEPLLMVCLGPVVLGIRWLSDGHRRALALLMALPSLVLMSVLKAYVVMALSVAAAVYYVWKRFLTQRTVALKPLAVVTATALGISGLVLGNSFFDRRDDSGATAFARQRAMAYNVGGGSNYQLDGMTEQSAAQRTVTQELLLAPVALLTALFRPFIFEAGNAVQLANALEASLLLFLVLRAWKRTSLLAMFRFLTGSPAMLFCVVFTVALGVGTGLSTGNMGTLSRYRTPMMPFFFAVVLLLDQWATHRAAGPQSAAANVKPEAAAG